MCLNLLDHATEFVGGTILAQPRCKSRPVSGCAAGDETGGADEAEDGVGRHQTPLLL